MKTATLLSNKQVFLLLPELHLLAYPDVAVAVAVAVTVVTYPGLS